MLARASILLALAAFVLVVAAAEGQAKSGTPITACGQVVTTSAVLTQDLVCSGDGVVVGASGITIDLKGFTLRGDRSLGHAGIEDAGYDGVTVENGLVRNFEFGVEAIDNADQIRATSLVASGNFQGIRVVGASASVKSSIASGNGSGGGIVVFGPSAAIQSATASGNAGFGIEIMLGDSARIQSSTVAGNSSDGLFIEGAWATVSSVTASGNGYGGISVSGDSASVKSSTVFANGSRGIGIGGDAAVIRGNRAEANGFAGGTSDLAGRGIDVFAYTTAPTGTNVARGNDDPGECTPALLC